jgi:hypothetical protein
MSDSSKIIPLDEGGYLVDYGDLVLPVPPPDMPLRPNEIPIKDFYRHLRALLPQISGRPGFEEERLATKTPERFVM